MESDLSLLIREWFDRVWNQKDLTAIAELASPDAILHGLGSVEAPGNLESFRAFHTNFVDAFPDICIEVEDVLVDGDRAAVRFSFTGTHRGGGLGFAATGKPVTATGMSFTRWQNGQIVEGWNEFDEARMLRQLSAM